MNYFEFYGIPVSFRVDESTLRSIFYRNSKQYHPDFHTLSEEEQQAEMLELATLNNDAYQTLSDPDQRIRYILKIKGLLEDEGKLSIPQEFLLDMMEINEALMELEFEPDQNRLETVKQEIERLEKSLDHRIHPILDTYDDQVGSHADLQAVLEYFLKKRYLLRVRENLSKFAPR